MKTYKVLSIDAWNSPDGWSWNNWFNVGTVNLDGLDNTRHILKSLRDQGYLSDQSKGKLYINDDQYNIVVCSRNDNMPIFAIEYGSEE